MIWGCPQSRAEIMPSRESSGCERSLAVSTTRIALGMEVESGGLRCRLARSGLARSRRTTSAGAWPLMTRRRHQDALLALARQAARDGEPIVRSLEYAFPHAGLRDVGDAFLLGDRLLVAPVLTRGATSRVVALPPGRWRGPDGRTVNVELTRGNGSPAL